MAPHARIAAALVWLTLAACVEQQPIVTNGRDAGPGLPPAPEVPGDLPPSDPPDCASCNELLTSSLRDGACRGNAKPSSAELLGAYTDCVCRTECTEACALHCGGAPRDSACTACATERCAGVERACREDVKR